MVTPRRAAGLVIAILLVAGWFAWLRPSALGGPATLVIVSGDSMEPRYSDGDLVLLRRRPSYRTGDIVAYPMKTYFDTGRLVIHRIVGGDDEGYVTRGDNRTTEDPWRPTASDIRGAHWVGFPRVGGYLAAVRRPTVLAALAAGGVLLGGLTGSSTRHRRRHGMKRHRSGSTGQGAPAVPFGDHRSALLSLAAGTGLLALGFLALSVISLRSPARDMTTVSDAVYAETGTFDYAIHMEPSTLYPDGVLRPPETDQSDEGAPDGAGPAPPPAFSSLAREAQVTFRYALVANGLVDFTGAMETVLEIRSSGGEWQRTTSPWAPQSFTGTAAERTLTVDLVSARTLIAQIESETGLHGGPYEIAVVTTVTGEGTRAGLPLETSFTTEFMLTYDGALIRPPRVLTATEETASTRNVPVARTLSLGVWTPPVSTARTTAITGLAASLGATVALGAYLGVLLTRDEAARIRTRYGSHMVDVEAAAGGRSEDAIRVASIRDLSRLAERFGSVILHEVGPSGHRYFVRDGDDTYVYEAGGPADRAARRRAAARAARV